MGRFYIHIFKKPAKNSGDNQFTKRQKSVFRLFMCMLCLFAVIAAYFPEFSVSAKGENEESGDWVKLVSVTPNHYDNYNDSITFTAIINYSLQSKDKGIVYLGFNTKKPHDYIVDTSENAKQIVSRGKGTVVLSETVTPVNWNTPLSFMQQFLDGYSELVKDFKIYANISEYPHGIPWTPLAVDDAVLTELPESADDTTLEIKRRTFGFSNPETVMESL